MKTKKNSPDGQTIKTKSVITPDIFLEQEEERATFTEGNLTDDDFEALGSINLANDLGDDEQIKYWEDLGKNRPTSEMQDYELSIDYELQRDDDEDE